MRAGWLLLAFGGAALAQPSCFDAANDRAALDECAQKEILPLEAAVVSRVNALRAKYRNTAGLREALEKSQDSWNAYRNGHCSVEAQARGGSEVAAQRAYASCSKRELAARLKELEGL